MIKRILVPLDGSALAERVLDEARPLAQSLGSTLVLIRVVPAQEDAVLYVPQLVDELREAHVRAAEEYLTTIAAHIATDQLPTETYVCVGAVAPTLADKATELHCDLIALTSHGMGGLGAAVFGSIALKLLHSAPCPVLVIRSTAGQLEGEEEAEESAADQALLRELSSTPAAR
ncbi:MAG: universal stress protein [Dehalococcoidia bacterium]